MRLRTAALSSERRYPRLVLRIIAGEFRSRRLLTPPGEVTRPMASRAKESLFNLLRGWFEGATVLDLFAGVGTMGLEAVSRGASRTVLVERDSSVFKLLQANIAALGCGDRALAIQGDALSAMMLESVPRPVDVVFLDPPYALMEQAESRRRVLEQAARCRTIMGEQGFLVLRTPVDPDQVDHTLPGFDGPEVHRHRQQMHVLLYAPTRRAPSPIEGRRSSGLEH